MRRIGTALPIRMVYASAWVTMTFMGRTARFIRQNDADRQKSYERLVQLGRTDLIEMYKVRVAYGSQ